MKLKEALIISSKKMGKNLSFGRIQYQKRKIKYIKPPVDENVINYMKEYNEKYREELKEYFKKHYQKK